MKVDIKKYTAISIVVCIAVAACKIFREESYIVCI